VGEAIFIFGARSGVSYEIKYELTQRSNPKLWIQEHDSHQPVTSIVEAVNGGTAEPADLFQTGPFGYLFPPNSSNYVPLPSQQGKPK